MNLSGGEGEKERGDVESLSIQEEPACVSAFKSWIASALPGDYIAIQAYLAPSREVKQVIQKLRTLLLTHTRLATTIGFGPRFLHSTGQLHKGGPSSVLAIQIVDEPEQDIPVPETGYTFATLIESQALGDCHALQQRERRVLRISLGKNPANGLKKLEGYFSDAG